MNDIDFEMIRQAGELMDAQDIPKAGRKLLTAEGILILDERPPVLRPFETKEPKCRISKHHRASKQRKRKSRR